MTDDPLVRLREQLVQAAHEEAIVGGSVEARSTRVGVVGQDRPGNLGPAVGGRKAYRVLLPQGRYEVIAYDGSGQEVGRARAPAPSRASTHRAPAHQDSVQRPDWVGRRSKNGQLNSRGARGRSV